MTASLTQLVVPGAPRLPGDPTAQTKTIQDHFNQVAGLQNSLMGPTGARFLDAPYGIFVSTADEVATSTTAVNTVQFSAVQSATGMTLGGTPTTQITASYPGLYDFTFLVQLNNTDTAAHDVYFWFRLNGADVTNSAHRFTAPVGNQRVTINAPLKMAQGDYIELVWNTTSLLVVLKNSAAQTSPVAIPAIPSVYANIQFMTANNSSSSDSFVPPAPPAPVPTPPPPPGPPPAPGPSPAPAPAPPGQDSDVQAIFTGLSAGAGAWWYISYDADRAFNPDGTGGSPSADNVDYQYQKDHSGNGYNIVYPSQTTSMKFYNSLGVKSLGIYSQTTVPSLGGSNAGFVACLGLRFDSGYYNTVFSDVNGAASTSTNGTYLRFNGDDGKLHFNAGTGSTRVEVADSIIEGGSKPVYVVLVWYDPSAHTLNMQINDNTVVSTACSALSAGQTALSLFANPFSDSSFGASGNGWDQMYGVLYSGVVIKNTALTSAQRSTLRYWVARQSGVPLAGAGGTPSPPPPPPAPAPPPPPPSVAPTIANLSRHPNDMLKIGNYWLEDNRWGTPPHTGWVGITEGTNPWQFQQQLERYTTVGANGEIAFELKWYMPQYDQNGVAYDTNAQEVKNYPSCIYGAKPGYASATQWPATQFALRLPDGATVPTPPSGTPASIAADWTPVGGSVSTVSPTGNTGGLLPEQVPVGALRATFMWQHNTPPTGVGHLSYDIWIQEQSAQNTDGFFNAPITHEIMIDIANWGNYGTSSTVNNLPWSRSSSWYIQDVTITGVLYHVHAYRDQPGAPGVQYNFPPGTAGLSGKYTNEETGQPRTGWKFIVFTPALPIAQDATGLVTVDIAGIINWLTTVKDSRGISLLTPTNRWMVSAELGVESVYGAGDIEVWNYQISNVSSAPPPPPPPTTTGIPSKLLGLYFQAYDATYQITQVPLDINVIYLFVAKPGSLNGGNQAGDGSFFWDFSWPVTPAQIQTCRARGQNVLLTCGGSGGAFIFSNRTQSTNFYNTVTGIIDKLGGLDGLDFNNFEGGTLTTGNVAAHSTECIWIAQQLRAKYGSTFAITMAPNPNAAPDLTFATNMYNAGVLTYAGPQYYDWTGFNAVNYISDSIINTWAPAITGAHVVMGTGANYSGGPALTDSTREWDRAVASVPTLRGSFAWNAQTDIANGDTWGSTMQGHVGNSPASAPAPAPTPAPPPGGAPFYPFGSRIDNNASTAWYNYGNFPTNYTNAQMDARVQTSYNKWKTARLKKAPTFVANSGSLSGLAGATITDGWYVDFGDGVDSCRSEGMGYGMLITVLMAGFDTQAQTYFNGLFKVYRGRPSYSGNFLFMDYRLDLSMNSVGGGYNAMDGDLDAMLALYMAHRQWGSTGTFNYLSEANSMVAAAKASFFSASATIMDSYHHVSRTSDYMAGHFRVFKAKNSGDTFWDTVETRCKSLVATIISGFSATAKLQPGFIYDPDSTQSSPTGPIPDTVAHIDNSQIEQYYDYNACRNPWRWATVLLLYGDTTWGGHASDITAFLKGDNGGDPTQTADYYHLDGTAVAPRWLNAAFAAPGMLGAMCNSAHQTYLNQCFTSLTDNFPTDYFDSELTLLALIVASGNWWKP